MCYECVCVCLHARELSISIRVFSWLQMAAVAIAAKIARKVTDVAVASYYAYVCSRRADISYITVRTLYSGRVDGREGRENVIILVC